MPVTRLSDLTTTERSGSEMPGMLGPSETSRKKKKKIRQNAWTGSLRKGGVRIVTWKIDPELIQLDIQVAG